MRLLRDVLDIVTGRWFKRLDEAIRDAFIEAFNADSLDEGCSLFEWDVA